MAYSKLRSVCANGPLPLCVHRPLRLPPDERRMSERSFESGQKAATSLFKRNRLDGAGVDVGHAAGDLFVPGRCNGLVSGLIQTPDERASKVGAIRHRKRKCFFQKL